MPIFVTSTGTDQGKTYVTSLLCKQLPNYRAVKPIISGYREEEFIGSDTDLIIKCQDNNIGVDDCSPWRFEAPLSPDLAANMQGEEINYDEVLEFCNSDMVDIIEGAGGVMSPITKQHTNIDLIKDTGSSALLVSSLYLGCISHILTSLEVLRHREINVAGLVLTPTSADSMDSKTVLASLEPQLQGKLKFFVLKYAENFLESWKSQPNLTSLVLEK